MRIKRGLVPMFWVLLASAALTTAGCDEADGPIEQAGEEVDEVINDAERAVEDATD